MTALRARLEDAVRDLLRDLVKPLGLKTVRVYAGEISGDADDVLARLNGLAPGVLVSIEKVGYRSASVERNRYEADVDLALYVVSTSQNTREDRLRGPGQIYEILEAIAARLTGTRPDIHEVGRAGLLEPQDEEELVHTPEVAVWRQTWTVTIQSELAERLAPDVTQASGRIGSGDEGDPAAPAISVSTLIS